MSINQKSGRQTFRRRFVSGSLFVSPCPPECNFQSETKIEHDLRLGGWGRCQPRPQGFSLKKQVEPWGRGWDDVPVTRPFIRVSRPLMLTLPLRF